MTLASSLPISAVLLALLAAAFLAATVALTGELTRAMRTLAVLAVLPVCAFMVLVALEVGT